MVREGRDTRRGRTGVWGCCCCFVCVCLSLFGCFLVCLSLFNRLFGYFLVCLSVYLLVCGGKGSILLMCACNGSCLRGDECEALFPCIYAFLVRLRADV